MDRELGKLPGLTFEEATENVKKNLEALSKQSREAKQDFLQVYNRSVNRRDGAVAMLKWLERSGFFEAPASSKNHLAQPGGSGLRRCRGSGGGPRHAGAPAPPGLPGERRGIFRGHERSGELQRPRLGAVGRPSHLPESDHSRHCYTTGRYHLSGGVLEKAAHVREAHVPDPA